MTNNQLNVTITAGLDKPKSVAEINNDIDKIKSQLKRLKLQAGIEKGKALNEINKQISELNKQKKQLYIDLKLRQRDLKQQYKQAVAQIQSKPINIQMNTDNAQRQMTGLSSSVRTASNETVNLASALKRVMTNAGLTISAQTALQYIRRMAQDATEALKEYDKYATNLSMITGGTKESADNIIADLSDKSFEFKAPINELEIAYETLLRSGKAAEELDDYLKSTVYLSKIGFEDMETSAENLVSIANAYKLQSEEIENVVSKLSALDTASITVAGKLATAMSKTAQSAQLAGLSIDELGAIIAGLKDTTGKTEDSIATSVNSLLSRIYNIKLSKYEIELEDGSTEDITESLSDTEKALKSVGISLRNTKGDFREVTEIIDDLSANLDKFNEVQINAITKTMAGTHHKNTFLALLSNWDKIKDHTKLSADSAGQAEQRYNAYLQSIESKSAALSTAMKELWNNVIPNNLAGDITEVTTEIVQFTDEYKILQTAIKSAAFYALAKGVILTKDSLTGMISSIKNVSYSMSLANQNTVMTAQRMSELQKMSRLLTDKQLKLILSNSNLTEAEMVKMLAIDRTTTAEARQKLATMGLSQANAAATASTFSLSGAIKSLWAVISANPIVALTIAFTSLITIYQTVQRKQEEMRQQIKDTADKTKELTDNIYSLYQAYADMKISVDNGTESKENLTTATDNLLDALGYEGEAVDSLIAKYGNLSDAINQATADKLRESLPDLADAVNVELEEAVKEATKNDTALHRGFDITADNTPDKELLKFIEKYNKQNGGVNFETVNSLTTRIDFEGDRDSAEGIKQRIESMQKLRQALFDEYGAENVQNLDFYTKLSDRISELTTAYDEYTVAYDNYNNTVAQAEIIQSLIGKEIPKTVDEYKAYRQELIKSAENSGQFIGTQEDIINAIDGTISKMNEFSDIRNQTANRDTAYNMFGVDDIVNDADEGTKKAFINSLSDSELAVLIQLDRNVFDKGIEGVKQAIADFNNEPKNAVNVETETSSLEELQKAYEDISKSADSFVKNQITVVSAFEEQDKHGQLSASTIQSLTEAGYAQALVTDKVTGAVTLNMQAYEQLNLQKKESIRLEAEQNKSALQDKFKEEQIALNDLAEEMKTANAERRKAIALEMAQHSNNMAEYYDEIAKFDGMLSSLDAPTFDNSDNGNSDNKEPIAVTTFKKALAEKEHLLAMEQITEEEFYTWLDSESERVYGNLADYQDELWKHEEEIYKWRKDKRQEEIDSEKEYIESLKDEYSEMIDSQIDEQEKLAESIEKAYDDKISAIDRQIDAIEKVNEAEERHKDILEAQKELEEASIKNRLVLTDNGWVAKADDEAVKEAKENLDKAYQENHISALEEQKEILETQKDNASEYYDKVVDGLEQQKTDREKMYDTLVNIYDEISGEKKQTTSNTDLVKKLTDGGDISKAVQGLTPTELTNAVKSGILTTDSNGNYTIDYSVLDNNTSSIAENTTALNNINDTLGKFMPETETANDKLTAGGFNLVADENGKLTKKAVTIDGKAVDGLGQKVDAVTKTEWDSKKNFGGYGSINNLVKAIQSGEFKYSSAVASQMFNNNVQSRIGQGLTKMPDTSFVNNVAPVVNQTFNIDGDATENTVNRMKTAARDIATEEINSYFQYLNNTMQSTFVKSRYGK